VATTLNLVVVQVTVGQIHVSK